MFEMMHHTLGKAAIMSHRRSTVLKNIKSKDAKNPTAIFLSRYGLNMFTQIWFLSVKRPVEILSKNGLGHHHNSMSN